MEDPIKMDDLGIPLFLEIPIFFVDLLLTLTMTLTFGKHDFVELPFPSFGLPAGTHQRIRLKLRKIRCLKTGVQQKTEP